MSNEVNAWWRSAYEYYAAFFWFVGTVTAALFAYFGNFGFRFLFLAAIPMCFIGLIRLIQANKTYNFRARLFGLPDLKVSLGDLILMQKKDMSRYYIGHGFLWEQVHAQKAVDYTDRNASELRPSMLYLTIRKYLGLISQAPTKGLPYLHAFKRREKPIYQPISNRYTHRSIAGTNGSGKGRAMAIDIIQAIVRGEAGIMVDPKLDPIIIDVAYGTLKALGREHQFFYFNPAYPKSSCRINPLKNYQEIDDLASRIIALMPIDGDETFKSFCHRALMNILQVLELMSDNPTLLKMRKLIDEDPNRLLARVGLFWLKKFPHTAKHAERLAGEDYTIVASEFIKLYDTLLDADQKHDAIDSLIAVSRYSEEHYKKLIMSIIPVLTVLTSGVLKELLSPDPTNDDPRPIVDISSVCRRNDFLYINLSSLRDGAKGSAMGSLFLNDAITVVADRYFYISEKGRWPLNLWADEASEMVNKATIQIANKSRASETCLTIAYQTHDDLIDRLAGEPAANMLMGNSNTKTQLRAEDTNSKEFFSDSTAKTVIKRMETGTMTSTTNMKTNLDYGVNHSKSVKTEESRLVSPESIGGLADLHSFTMTPGGSVYKVRYPYITVPEHLQYKPKPYETGPFGTLPSLESIGQRSSDSRIMFDPQEL